jgi:DNA-binding NarL/FixJ family response regulator
MAVEFSTSSCFGKAQETMRSDHVRVLLADDHDIVRTGVRSILEGCPNWKVCAEARSGKEAVRLVSELKPHIVVLDLEMDDLDGISVTRQIKKNQPQIEVLIFSMHGDEILIRGALSAGARAFVLKSEGAEALVKAIECATRHEPFFAARASQTLLDNFHASSESSAESSLLTEREREIVPLLANGMANKEVATALGISLKTVETHRAAIMKKLGFSSIVGLVRYAVREGLIRP